MGLVAAGLVLGACGGGSDDDEGSSPPTAAGGSEAPAGSKIEVSGKEFSYTPNTVTLKAGEAATIVLKNTGAIEHDITVDEAGFKLTTAAGQTADKALTVAKAGTYKFYCSVAGHETAGMKGELKVE